MVTSGEVGGSYGSVMPMKFGISPASAFLYLPGGVALDQLLGRAVDVDLDVAADERGGSPRAPPCTG